MHYICRIILLLLLISGCNFDHQQEAKLASFDDSITLNGRVLSEIETLFKQGSVNVNLSVLDTFLVVQSTAEPFFQIYSTNSHKLLVEFGKLGNGPQDFAAPQLLKQYNFDPRNGSPVFSVFDLRSQLFTTINILDVVNGNELNYETEALSIPNKKFFPYFFYSDDEFTIGQPVGGDQTRLFIFDSKNEQEIFISSTPELPYIIPSSMWNQVYRSTAVINKEKEIIAVAPLLLGQVDFFKTNGEYIKSLQIEEPTKYQEYFTTVGATGDNPYYSFVSLEAHGNKIYGLNLNNIGNEYFKSRSNPLKIMSFDWNGTPIKEYVLDNRLITSFTFDPIHNRFYTFCPDERDHNIVVYEVEENM